MSSYFIRLTPEQSTTLREVSSIFEEIANKFVVSCEQDPREHYHIAVWGVNRSSDNLRAYIKAHIPCQVYISGKEITNKLNTIAYTIKDGNYVFKNLNVDELLLSVSMSKPKIKFETELEKIDKAYDGDDKKYLAQVFDLHVRTNKKVYMQHIKSQLLLTKLKYDKYGTYKNYLIEKIIDNI